MKYISTKRVKKNIVYYLFVIFISVWLIGCNRYKDGRHPAKIYYSNFNTNFSNTYSKIEVEVEDDKVVKIYWPRGGWLDYSHITPAKLDKNGHTTIFWAVEARMYEVQLLSP